MQTVTAVIRNGRLELDHPIAWPDGTKVEIRPTAASIAVVQPSTSRTIWPVGFLDEVRNCWGNEPFERPPQSDFANRVSRQFGPSGG